MRESSRPAITTAYDIGQGVHAMPSGGAELKAPFPYPGGKSKVADMVWERLGDVDNYVEPFAGTLAVLLRRPAAHFANGYRVETCNDTNHFLVNFWRAVQQDPDAVAKWADWPVHEADLHARHRWLMRSCESEAWRMMMAENPEYFDPKIAGWWVWGACCWIGSGWCNDERTDYAQTPFARRKGVNVPSDQAPGSAKIPELASGGGRGGLRGRPQLTDAFDIGRGVNGGAAGSSKKVPLISGPGDGVDSVAGLSMRIPILRGGCGQGVDSLPAPGDCDARRAWLTDWMRRLADRLRLVRTCYGHWSRICDSDSTLTRLGTTGVFLDPPYPIKTTRGKRAKGLYANDGQDLDALRDEVLAWCVKWGREKDIRVAVCGYEGDGYESLVEDHGWKEQSWEASGGYGNQSKTNKGKAANAKRERIWFSPHCLGPDRPGLFDEVTLDSLPARAEEDELAEAVA